MLLVLMLLGAGDVIGRYLFNRPIMGTLEISEILLAGIVFFGWAYSQAVRGHVRVELFFERFSPRAQAVLDSTALLLMLAFVSLVAWQSALLAIERWEAGRVMQSLNIPMAPFLLFVPLGAFFLCLELILQIIHRIPNIARGE